eukprot:SAG31_NODE_5223_length_2665_cov_1.982853_2_plen_167_part_00
MQRKATLLRAPAGQLAGMTTAMSPVACRTTVTRRRADRVGYAPTIWSGTPTPVRVTMDGLGRGAPRRIRAPPALARRVKCAHGSLPRTNRCITVLPVPLPHQLQVAHHLRTQTRHLHRRVLLRRQLQIRAAHTLAKMVGTVHPAEDQHIAYARRGLVEQAAKRSEP